MNYIFYLVTSNMFGQKCFLKPHEPKRDFKLFLIRYRMYLAVTLNDDAIWSIVPHFSETLTWLFIIQLLFSTLILFSDNVLNSKQTDQTWVAKQKLYWWVVSFYFKLLSMQAKQSDAIIFATIKKTQHVHFRLHANYFLLHWKIPEEMNTWSICNASQY